MEKLIVINEVKNPVVSVIIPTLNEEKYIGATLHTLKYQDYKGKFEVIVSDSNSKDRTVEIAKKFADKIIVSDKKGVSRGRNLGVKYTKGKILLFVDADTILLPNAISKVVEQFYKKRIIGVLLPLIGDDFKKNVYYFFAAGVLSLLEKTNLHPVYAVCFACDKKVFLKVGGFDENLHLAEDIDLGQRLKKVGKVVFSLDTFVITSTRRLKKWSVIKQLRTWPFGYFSIKLFKKQPKYPPIR